MEITGRPFTGHLHSPFFVSGAEIPIFEMGSSEQYEIQEDEYIAIHSILFVTSSGGDCYMNIGATNSTEPSEIVFRGTFGSLGGLSREQIYPAFRGPDGGRPFLTTPLSNGSIDITIQGTIHKATSGSKRPGWKAGG